jgi:hypothetical protein
MDTTEDLPAGIDEPDITGAKRGPSEQTEIRF